MINTFHVDGFKCFQKTTFDLGDLTVFTGNNGSGKSSVIQALLLVRIAIEKNALDSTNLNFSSQSWKNIPIPINSEYELKLGTAVDLFNENYLTDSNFDHITLKLDGESFELKLPDDDDDDLSVKIDLKESSFDLNTLPFWRLKEFYYLFTERLGPRLSLTLEHTDFLHCGFIGEYTGQVLLKNDFLKIQDSRLFPNSKSENLPLQVDAWLESICPGTSVKVDALGSMNAQIKLRNASIKNHVLATNIGFGISYSLPVIVNGLIAKPGSVYIVENPEAHLHPKGQSQMGYFLGKVASAGVKVIVETHSEHVINGIRRACLSTSELDTNNVFIYFLAASEHGEKIRKIEIRQTGDLSSFPRDFFDQVNQDMAEIFRLKK